MINPFIVFFLDGWYCICFLDHELPIPSIVLKEPSKEVIYFGNAKNP